MRLMALLRGERAVHAGPTRVEQEGGVMTSEHISTTGKGRHVAVRPESTVEAPSTTFHYHDRERLASYRRTAPRPPAARAGALITLLVGLTVLYAEWDFYPQTYQGQSDANWALGFMMLSTAGALRILMGNPGRHLASAAAILVSGVGFLYRAVLVSQNTTDLIVYEATCGVLLVTAALMALFSPELAPEPPPASDAWG